MPLHSICPRPCAGLALQGVEMPPAQVRTCRAVSSFEASRCPYDDLRFARFGLDLQGVEMPLLRAACTKRVWQSPCLDLQGVKLPSRPARPRDVSISKASRCPCCNRRRKTHRLDPQGVHRLDPQGVEMPSHILRFVTISFIRRLPRYAPLLSAHPFPSAFASREPIVTLRRRRHHR